jgi:DNA polymerase III subunit delta'
MKFSDVVGQEEVITRLRRVKKEGRVAHAQLFLGPEGCGNLAIALAYAQFLNCPNATESDSCGECPTCKKISNLQYADLHFSFPFHNKINKSDTVSDDFGTEFRSLLLKSPYISYDQWVEESSKDHKVLFFSVKEGANILHKLSLTSYEGNYKIIIIWKPELFKADIANMLLKIVEEPPKNTLFFFVANSSENIINTILSRLQIIQIPKLKTEFIRERLIAIGVSENKASDIAHFADGNWGSAIDLIENEDPNEFLALQFQTWMRNCYSKKVSALFSWANEMAEQTRERQKQFLNYSLNQVRQNLILNYSTNSELCQLTEKERAFSLKFSPFINHLNVEDLMQELERAFVCINQNVNSKILFMDLSIKVFRLLQRKQ